MNQENFPIEFNNEIDEVKKSDNEIYTMAVDRLNKLEKGHNDITGAIINLKRPAKEHQTTYIYEATVVLYMGSENIAGTEKGANIRATLDGALDAVERQVRERRTQERSY